MYSAVIVALLEVTMTLAGVTNANGSFDLVADLWAVAEHHNQAELIVPSIKVRG